MIISSSPVLNFLLNIFYSWYSLLPWTEQIYTVDQLCASNVPINPPLYCQYVMLDGIRPIKAEVLHEEPYVIHFHQVITNGAADRVIHLIAPYEHMAGVGGLGGQGRTDNMIRNSTTGILQEPGYSSCIIKPWYRTLSALAGLNITAPSAEQMSITHYEPGNFYTVHHDSDDTTPYMMRRLGTFLLYLTDGFTGGNTIFPQMQLAILPEKGDGLVFYSHLLDGPMDDDTLHSGCPVYGGNKWIGSLWIRNTTQHGSATVCRQNERYARPWYVRPPRSDKRYKYEL